jgi:4-hydroxy-3-polyprenylbenzoate decarboxylase
LAEKAEKDRNFHEKPMVVVVTGASGAVYAVSLLRELGRREIPVNLIASRMGRDMLKREADIPVEGSLVEHLAALGIDTKNFQGYDVDNFSAPPASGSYLARAMVVCPCSVKTLSAVAAGSCRTLIERAAEVMFKERRKLILVIRESPYSLVQIENMRSATLAGALILPASPAFYHHPGKIDDLVDFIVARILDHLEIPHDLLEPWGRKN